MNLVLLLAAIVCAAVASLMGFDVIANTHALGWLSVAVALFLVAQVVPDR